jgi:hypothetical protein
VLGGLLCRPHEAREPESASSSFDPKPHDVLIPPKASGVNELRPISELLVGELAAVGPLNKSELDSCDSLTSAYLSLALVVETDEETPSFPSEVGLEEETSFPETSVPFFIEASLGF